MTQICCQVGSWPHVVIPLDVLLLVHGEIAQVMRALGLDGAELDFAIEARLPGELAKVVFGNVSRREVD
jgi:hypothetical protein